MESIKAESIEAESIEAKSVEVAGAESIEATGVEKKTQKVCSSYNRNRPRGCENADCDMPHLCRYCNRKGLTPADHPVTECTLSPPVVSQYCEVCKVQLSGIQEMIDVHYTGKKHLKNCEKISFHCDVCNIFLLHAKERDAHLSGKSHKKEAAKKRLCSCSF